MKFIKEKGKYKLYKLESGEYEIRKNGDFVMLLSSTYPIDYAIERLYQLSDGNIFFMI